MPTFHTYHRLNGVNEWFCYQYLFKSSGNLKHRHLNYHKLITRHAVNLAPGDAGQHHHKGDQI